MSKLHLETESLDRNEDHERTVSKSPARICIAPPNVKAISNRQDCPRSQCPFSSVWTIERTPIAMEPMEDRHMRGDRVRTYSLGGTRTIYHLDPWERSLGPKEIVRVIEAMKMVRLTPPPEVEGYEALHAFVVDLAKKALATRSPGSKGRTTDGQTLATIDQLAEVVARYTTGFGVLEHLLQDDRVEDVYIDAPCGSVPVHVTIGGVSGSSSTIRAETNIYLSDQELQAIITRLRYYSRRPFSEAFPVLETDVPGFESRATLVGQPLSPHGPALALRRHSRRAWTLLRLVQNGTLSAMAAGLISFLVDGRCSMLVCGPRGAGKSSLLAAMMFEFPPSQRILTIEDTLELPVRKMQELGYRAQSLLVEGGLDRGVDDAAEDALRVSLRLGESALVMGEVRGKEAVTLYESMRTGKAGSAVLGTIHGDSARSVYERVVHDMGIAPEAFGATDVILSIALIRPHGSHRQERRLAEVAALAKEQGPGEFDQIMDSFSGEGPPLDKVRIVERVARSWGIGYEEAVQNILLRGRMRQMMVEAQRHSAADLLGPGAVCACNEFLWERIERSRTDPEAVLEDFRERLKEMA
jgi:flagellar protein FlaI